MSMREAEREHVEGLETDLAQARMMLGLSADDLARSNADLKATNEELVASNEELQSTNEELHSVNEELQSLNEQLFAVNTENERQIVELREMTDDIEHLLEGSDVGTVFLDRELRIRRFTSRIAAAFRFKSDDVGRKITDFTHTLVRPQLYEEIATALERGTLVVDAVDDSNGKHFLLRSHRIDRIASARA
jgi:two-component system CheB/CheR fusion protein